MFSAGMFREHLDWTCGLRRFRILTAGSDYSADPSTSDLLSPSPAHNRFSSSQDTRRSSSFPTASSFPSFTTIIWSACLSAARRCDTTRRCRATGSAVYRHFSVVRRNHQASQLQHHSTLRYPNLLAEVPSSFSEVLSSRTQFSR